MVDHSMGAPDIPLLSKDSCRGWKDESGEKKLTRLQQHAFFNYMTNTSEDL